MDLKDTMLEEISQTKKANTIWFGTYVEYKKQKHKQNKWLNKNKHTDRVVITRGGGVEGGWNM